MKFKKLFLTLGLALGLGIGVGAGLKANSVKEAKAAILASGNITVDLTGESWGTGASGQNISVYFWDDAEHNGWGGYNYAGQNQFMVSIDYSLEFVPTHMKAVRYSNWYAKDSWKANPWCTGDDAWGKWAEGENVDFSANGNIVIAGTGKSFTGTAYMHGTTDGTNWGTTAQLSGVKLNGSNHIEYYANKSFVANEKFGVKLFNEDWITSFTLSDYLKGEKLDDASDDAFFLNASTQIECRTPGTYSVFYDRNAGSVYLTDTVHAAADDWAQRFFKDNSSCSATKTNWGTFADEYEDLATLYGSTFTNIFTSEEHKDHEVNPATLNDVQKAVQRYDYVLLRYHVNPANTDALGYEDFMGRVGGELTLSQTNISPLSFDNNGLIIIVALPVLST